MKKGGEPVCLFWLVSKPHCAIFENFNVWCVTEINFLTRKLKSDYTASGLGR